MTKRKFGIKEPEMMGCTLMGATLVGMMASFPQVKERVKHFDRELENNRIVLESLLSISGTRILSEYPRRHTLTRVDTTGSFDKVAENHKKRGFYLSAALEERGITGIIPGATKIWKFNTYGTTKKQAQHLAGAFIEIANENGIPLVPTIIHFSLFLSVQGILEVIPAVNTELENSVFFRKLPRRFIIGSLNNTGVSE